MQNENNLIKVTKKYILDNVGKKIMITTEDKSKQKDIFITKVDNYGFYFPNNNGSLIWSSFPDSNTNMFTYAD